MIISGRYGSVGGISQVADWSIDLVSTDNAQANSFTRAGKVRDEGVCDWTGNFNTVGTLSLETLDSFSFLGRTGAATFTGTGMTYSGNAMIQSIAITGDLSAGGRVTTAVTFGGNGKLTKAAGSGQDTATHTILLAKDCVFTWNGGEINIKSFNFTINHEAQTYVGSDTVENGVCWTRRYPGIIDWTGNIVTVNTEPLGENGTLGELTIQCGETELLSLAYARLISTTGLSVSPASGAIIEATTNFGMVAHKDSDIGHIQLFGKNIWPEAA